MKQLCIFLGPPGSGKGTQAQFLQDAHGVTVLSTGNLIRQEIKRQTHVGKAVEACVRAGKLVPDAYLIGIIEPLLSELDLVKSITIFDGFPRTLAQAEQFDALLKQHDKVLDQVFYFDASLEIILKRIGGRRVCSYCNKTYHQDYLPPKIADQCDVCSKALIQRDDDSPETVQRRYTAYCSETAVLKDYYSQLGLCTVIDTTRPLSHVTTDLVQSIL